MEIGRAVTVFRDSDSSEFRFGGTKVIIVHLEIQNFFLVSFNY